MIEPNEFLLQASELVKDIAPTEVSVRSALSRAYYSLYHETYEHLKINYQRQLIETIITYLENKKLPLNRNKIIAFDENYINSNMSMHTTVQKTLGKLNEDYADDYSEFRNWRTIADYRLEETLNIEREKVRITAIAELIKKIKDLQPPPDV